MNQEVMNKIMTQLHARWDCFASQIEQRAMFFTCEGEEHSSIIV